MATVADTLIEPGHIGAPGSRVARAIDRWIYVYMAASFIVVTLAGFIPDALQKEAAIRAGQRPPFPLVLHIHAVVMGLFLALLLTQTVLMATHWRALHQWLGRSAMVLVPAIVVVGFILAPTNYHLFWNAAQSAPPALQQELQHRMRQLDLIALMQIRIGILFPLLVWIGLNARKTDSALHKRMMILATAVPLGAAIDRMDWLPTTLPASPLGSDLYILAIVSPMFVWDLARTRSVLRAYVIWIGICVLVSVPLYALWGTQWVHTAVPRLMGV
jgi:hypothetical protein